MALARQLQCSEEAPLGKGLAPECVNNNSVLRKGLDANEVLAWHAVKASVLKTRPPFADKLDAMAARRAWTECLQEARLRGPEVFD